MEGGDVCATRERVGAVQGTSKGCGEGARATGEPPNPKDRRGRVKFTDWLYELTALQVTGTREFSIQSSARERQLVPYSRSRLWPYPPQRTSTYGIFPTSIIANSLASGVYSRNPWAVRRANVVSTGIGIILVYQTQNTPAMSGSVFHAFCFHSTCSSPSWSSSGSSCTPRSFALPWR